MRTNSKILNSVETKPVTGTALATTSGTTKDFSIPSWAKKITLSLVGVSTNSTSTFRVQLGDAGGIETTGYLAYVANHSAGTISTATNGFDLTVVNVAAATYDGVANFYLADASTFTWSMDSNVGTTSGPEMFTSTGTKSLSEALTTIRLTTSAGDTFDEGKVNVLFE